MRVRRSASDACMQCGLLNVLLCSGRISCKRCTTAAHASRSCLPHSPLAPRLLPPRLGCRCRHPCQPLVNLAFDDACDAAHLRRPCARVSCRKTQGLPSINGSRRRSIGRVPAPLARASSSTQHTVCIFCDSAVCTPAFGIAFSPCHGARGCSDNRSFGLQNRNRQHDDRGRWVYTPTPTAPRLAHHHQPRPELR